MNEENNRLKKLFSDFEPEVNEASVEEQWEKMKYFLPQEKKRRGFAYLLGCLGLAVIVAGGLLTLFVMNYNEASSSPVAQRAETPATYPSAASSSLENKTPSVTDQSPARQPAPANAPPPALLPETNSPQSSAHPPRDSRIKNDPEIHRLPGSNSQSGHAASNETPPPAEDHALNSPANTTADSGIPAAVSATLSPGKDPVNESREEQAVFRNKNEERSEPSSIPAVNEAPVFLPVVFPEIQDSSADEPAVTLTPIRPPAASPRRFFRIQAFGGPAFTHTELKDSSGKTTYNRRDASAGLSLGYQLKNRISFSGQFMYSQSKISYERTQLYRRLSVPNLVPAVAGGYDTTLVSSTTRISSASGYALGLGIGYQFVSRFRFELLGNVFFNWRRVNYTFSQVDSDSAVQANTVPGFSSQAVSPVPSNFPRQRVQIEQRVSTKSINAGITAGYKLYRSVWLIFRPSYCLQLPNDKGRITEVFTVRRNVLHLDFGIQLRLR